MRRGGGLWTNGQPFNAIKRLTSRATDLYLYQHLFYTLNYAVKHSAGLQVEVYWVEPQHTIPGSLSLSSTKSLVAVGPSYPQGLAKDFETLGIPDSNEDPTTVNVMEYPKNVLWSREPGSNQIIKD
ncbi:hypothetical protein SISNIDRAFT_491666 [Sistotremastrum niveocremeum HHB9708]|uniref:Uncharacterized protein n=1 Tax=Sistotremastrum niveocremeum HHB9708 TaxID=1314777 RepID=A0A164MJV0_9AGAM|nr:hypothetical protein SISNIDRAFT_491666 [Sistotremastrum niveocremeum HHB9708]